MHIVDALEVLCTQEKDHSTIAISHCFFAVWKSPSSVNMSHPIIARDLPTMTASSCAVSVPAAVANEEW